MVALEAALQFEDTRESMQAFCVGQYMEVPTIQAYISLHDISCFVIGYSFLYSNVLSFAA